MADDPHHEHLVRELSEQFDPVFTNSPQGVYLYLDDAHKSCNQKFAEMLGYATPNEWVENEYPINDVAEEDQEIGIQAYMEASRNLKASSFTATWVRRDGTKIKTEVTMVPVPYKNEVFVLHFITVL